MDVGVEETWDKRCGMTFCPNGVMASERKVKVELFSQSRRAILLFEVFCLACLQRQQIVIITKSILSITKSLWMTKT